MSNRNLLGKLHVSALAAALSFGGGLAALTVPAISLAAAPSINADRSETLRPGLQVGARTAPADAQGRYSVIVRFKEESLASYDGGVNGLAATSPRANGDNKLDVSAPASQSYLQYLDQRQQQHLDTIGQQLGRAVTPQFQYLNVLNAASVRLTLEEADKIAGLDFVRAVYLDELRTMQTDAGPAWIGAPAFWDGESTSGNENLGAGVLIGIIDSGFNHDHPSFAATGPIDGFVHTNPFGPGVYKGACLTTPSLCNDKLVGAYSFHTTDTNPEDADGHGSHVASTAAGNYVNAPLGATTVQISGVAPHANLINYKICSPTCPNSSSIAAVNQAITDGVDLLNYSISGSDSPWNDSVDLAFLDAAAAGIFTTAAAGNDGPDASTAAHSGPWNAAVANSSHNRVLGPQVDAGGMTGLVSADGTGPAIGTDVTANLLDALVVAPTNPLGCNAAGGFAPGTFTGAIAFIQRGDCAFAEKVANAQAAGAVGVLTFNNAGGPAIVMGGLESTSIPAVMVDRIDGLAIRAALPPGGSSATLHSEVIRGTRDSWGDVMSTDSSRGPSQFDVLKPDYSAPGTNILAAFRNAEVFGIISGTSMASPHGTGAAALLVAEHPTWTPAEIKSAIALTAQPNMLNQDGATPAGPFDRGSGRVNLASTATIGAVMDETPANFEAADPGAGGDPRTLNLPSITDGECIDTCTFTRTLSSVATVAVDYTVDVVEPAGVTIDVTPATFTLGAGADQVLTVEVTVNPAVALPGTWAAGQLSLEPVGGATTTLLNESFTATGLPVGWTRFLEAGAATQQWNRTTASSNTAPASFFRRWDSSGNQVDWLISAPVVLPADPATLSFFDRVQFPADYDRHSVHVSAGSCLPADGEFVELGEVGVNANDTGFFPHSYSLADYAGDTVCVAFLYEGNNADSWYVDDIQINATPASAYSTLRMPVTVRPALADAAIVVTPTDVTATVDQGATSSTGVAIQNIGGEALTWSVLSTAPRGGATLVPNGRLTPIETAALPEGFVADRITGFKGELVATPSAPPPRGVGGTTITQSTSLVPVANRAVACATDGTPQFTTDNQFLRVFTLANFGITDAFDVASVQFAIENANVATDVTVNLYSLTGPLLYANMTLLGSASQTFNAQSLTQVSVPVDGVVPANGTLVVEIVPEDLTNVGVFFPGFNSAGQSGPSYIASAGCGILEPTTYQAIGFGDRHLVMSVTSDSNLDCGVNGSASWATAAPTSGTVASGATGGTTLSFDADGLTVGTHTTNLCIASNDPAESTVIVPVTLEVEAAPAISLSDDSVSVQVEAGDTTTFGLGISNIGNETLTWDVATAAPESGEAPSGVLPVGLLYDNGPFVSNPGAGPGGSDLSVLQSVALGMSSYGANISAAGAFRVADDFTISDPAGWTLTSLRFYGYQTGSTATSTFTSANVRIWDGPPGAPGSNIVYGDTTTNRLSGTGNTNAFRVTETTLTNTQRPVMYVDATVDVTLEAGTYWADWQLGGSLASGPWQPPITIPGQTTTGNALQFATTWAPLVDGDPTAVPPTGTLTPQGVPFQVSGFSATECVSPSAIPWLTIAPPTSGSAELGETDTVTLNFDSTGLAEGLHNAQVCVSSNDAETPLIGVPVSLLVGELPVPAAIEVTPTELEATVAIDGTASQTLTIANSGTEDLTWSIIDTENGLAGVDYQYGLTGGGTYVAHTGFGRASAATPVGQAQRVVHPAPQGAPVANLTENFDDVTLLPGAGWGQINNSAPIGLTGWFQATTLVGADGIPGTNDDSPFAAHSGDETSYIGANFNNTAGTGTISNWLLTPEVTLTNGTELRFYTRSTGGEWADRLEVRLSTAGASSNVGTGATGIGDFTTLLLTVNPTLTPITGYPSEWTEFTATVSGLPAPTSGRFGFRYFVTAGGPDGSNSDYIGIDTLSVVAGGPPPASCDNPADLPWLSVAPASGITAGESSTDVTVDFDADGLAAGTYEGTLCVSSNDAANPLVEVPVSLTVAELEEQTITFGALPDVAITVGTVSVSATASSGLTVSFTSDTPAVCTVSGTTVTLVTVGTCSIRASQAGDGEYAAADDVVQSFEVTADVDVVITPGTLPNAQIDTPYSVTVTASGAGTTAPFTYAVTAGTLPAGLTLNATTGEIAGTPTTLGSSTFTITATDSTPAGSGGPFIGSQEYTINVRDEFIFADGFEDEALTKIEIGGAGKKRVDLPLVNAFADQADGRVRNIVALTVQGKRVGTVQLRCDAKACEVRVASRKADATWNAGTWWLVDSDPFSIQVEVGAKLLKNVERPGQN